MSGLNLQHGCVDLPVLPECTLVWEGEAVCGIDAWYVGTLGTRREQGQVALLTTHLYS